MNDELECFREAIKLGCPYFSIYDRSVCFRLILPDADYKWVAIPFKSIVTQRMSTGTHASTINRYAANVCAEWLIKWQDHRCNCETYEWIEHKNLNKMIEAARNFGNKYDDE